MAEVNDIVKQSKPRQVKLIFPHERSAPGTVKSFFNIKCKANKDGIYECAVDSARAKQELSRKNQWKLMRPQELDD